ncbi:MAG: beta-lactamase family protein [Anaerolineae bacterium]|nr:beta-lactamase family protein [Anaerolineae bacterium]
MVRSMLPRATPESQGIASSSILQFVEAVERQIHELHAFMLVRHGKVVAEGWWSPYGRSRRHMLYSLSKSFTSTGVGIAIAEGRFSIDDPVISFFPDDLPTEVSENLAAMRVRHLLSMSTGQAEDTWGYMPGRPDGNWTKGFFEVPVSHPPGTHFLYNTGATYMLSAIVQKTTGMKLVDYLQTRLFEPLGIEDAVWEESPQGINLGGIGLRLRIEDVARFGQLYLQKGQWEGRPIIPEAWVAEATAFQTPTGEDGESDWAQGYGYQFWHCRHGAYRGDGVFGQYCIVMPEQDAVLAITSGLDLFDAQQSLDLTWEILLPAMEAKSLPEDAAAHGRLTGKLWDLHMPPVEGARSSSIAALVSGKIYALDANELNIKAIGFAMMESNVPTVTIQCARKANASIVYGYNEWCDGAGYLPNSPLETELELVSASGAWTADDTFTMVVRLYETPFYHTFVFHFDGDDLLVESQVNVSFDAARTFLLMGHVAPA